MPKLTLRVTQNERILIQNMANKRWLRIENMIMNLAENDTDEYKKYILPNCEGKKTENMRLYFLSNQKIKLQEKANKKDIKVSQLIRYVLHKEYFNKECVKPTEFALITRHVCLMYDYEKYKYVKFNEQDHPEYKQVLKGLGFLTEEFKKSNMFKNVKRNYRYIEIQRADKIKLNKFSQRLQDKFKELIINQNGKKRVINVFDSTGNFQEEKDICISGKLKEKGILSNKVLATKVSKS